MNLELRNCLPGRCFASVASGIACQALDARRSTLDCRPSTLDLRPSTFFTHAARRSASALSQIQSFSSPVATRCFVVVSSSGVKLPEAGFSEA